MFASMISKPHAKPADGPANKPLSRRSNPAARPLGTGPTAGNFGDIAVSPQSAPGRRRRPLSFSQSSPSARPTIRRNMKRITSPTK